MGLPRGHVKEEKGKIERRRGLDSGSGVPAFSSTAVRRCRFRCAVSRILSATCGAGGCASIYLSPKGDSRRWRDAAYPGSLDGPPDPLFCLAPDWVCPAFIVAFEAVSSYLPFSPLPFDSLRAVCFLRHFPSRQVSPPRPCFRREPCPVVSGLSSHSKEQADAHTPEPTDQAWPTCGNLASSKKRGLHGVPRFWDG